MPKRELVVVADDAALIALPRAIADIPVRTIDWHDVSGLSSVGDAALLVDVDLRNLAKVKLIKENLPPRRRHHCRIVAVERGSHQARAQAHGLDASAVLRRPIDILALKAVLERHFPAPEEELGLHPQTHEAPAGQLLASEAGGLSIVSAAAELHRMFAALACDGSLEISKIRQVGDDVIDAVTEVGLAKWLDTVRNYHESTFQHCLIVTGVATAFGHRNGMRRSDVLTLTMAALLHDIGKAQIPLAILDKPANLTQEEIAVIQQHPVIGSDYLRAQNDVPADIADAVRHHHEYLDGTGYPDGLWGQQIHDVTRIITVCDVYGALIERRSYRAPASPETAVNNVMDLANAGKVERDLVRALRRCVLG